MASKKKHSEGIALLSVYSDEDDEEMEDAEEDEEKEEEKRNQEEVERVEEDQLEEASFMDEERGKGEDSTTPKVLDGGGASSAHATPRSLEEDEPSRPDWSSRMNFESGERADDTSRESTDTLLDQFLPPRPRDKCSEELQAMDATICSRDAISWLPDEVLGKILSLLPTEEAASTSVLCKKWRNVYRLVDNLDFDDSALGMDKLEREVLAEEECFLLFLYVSKYVFPESFKKFVDTTLALQGDYRIKKFSLKCHTGKSIKGRKACVNRWISNVVERGVLELDLRIKGVGQHLMARQLFKSKTLVKLTLGTQIRLGKLPSDMSLPSLKTLFMDTVCFEKEDFSGVLLAGCPVLEELSYVHHDDFEETPSNISSLTVKRLSFDYNCEDMFWRNLYLSLNLPNLVYLDYSDLALIKYPQVNLESLVEAKLDLRLYEVVAQLQDLTQLFLGIRNVEILHLSPVSAHVIYGNCRDKLPMFNNLVKLSFKSKTKQGWKLLPYLLKLSPNLETLIIQDLNDNICDDVLMHLNEVKVLHILSYGGTDQELRLLKSFLWKTQGLELVQVDVTAKDESVIVETKRHLMIVFGDYCDIAVSKARNSNHPESGCRK